jgi:hypothetical protein
LGEHRGGVTESEHHGRQNLREVGEADRREVEEEARGGVKVGLITSIERSGCSEGGEGRGGAAQRPGEVRIVVGRPSSGRWKTPLTGGVHL